MGHLERRRVQYVGAPLAAGAAQCGRIQRESRIARSQLHPVLLQTVACVAAKRASSAKWKLPAARSRKSVPPFLFTQGLRQGPCDSRSSQHERGNKDGQL